MTNVQDIVAQIERQSQQHTADERFVRTIEVGQCARQGDIYIERVGDDYHRGEEIQDRQLAPGNSKGSRHVVAGEVEVFAAPTQDDLLHGPVIVAEQRFTVTHPEHADVSLPSGIYRVGYQLDPRRMRRVED